MGKSLSNDFIHLPQAAHQLGITRGGLWFLVRTGTVKAERLGRYWYLAPAEVERVKELRQQNKGGRNDF